VVLLVSRTLAGATAVLFAVATMAGAPPAAPPARIKVVALEGMQLLPLQVMLAARITERHQIQIEVVRVGSPDGIYTIMQTGDFHVGFAAWPNVALLRSRGARITTVYSTSRYTNEVMVPTDSSIRHVGDLRGKRVGVFGGPAAATTWLFRASALKVFAFDPMKEARIHYSAAPILQMLLARGELDAILSLDPHITLMLESGRFRSVGSIGSMWRAATGQDPLLLAVTVNEPWARDNPEIVRRFVSAYRESLDALRVRADLWPELARSAGVKTDHGLDLFSRRSTEAFVSRWDATLFEAQLAYAATIRQTFGDAPGVPSEIPAGTFDSSFLP
jgi:NitT/TauT family transport system substrate-binding protein